MSELLGASPELYDAGQEGYPGWLFDRTTDVNFPEWIKIEPSHAKVSIHWSTYLDNPFSVVDRLVGRKISRDDSQWWSYLERAPLNRSGAKGAIADEITPTFEGSITELQDELESQMARVSFLLINSDYEAFQWREEGSAWQLGWLGDYEAVDRALALSDTATDHVAEVFGVVMQLVEGLRK
jgi:hypothetical protein